MPRNTTDRVPQQKGCTVAHILSFVTDPAPLSLHFLHVTRDAQPHRALRPRPPWLTPFTGGLNRPPSGLPGAAAGSPISRGASNPKSSSSPAFNAASVPLNPASFIPGKVVAGPDMDPCLGWDTEACEASGRMSLGKANEGEGRGPAGRAGWRLGGALGIRRCLRGRR